MSSLNRGGSAGGLVLLRVHSEALIGCVVGGNREPLTSDANFIIVVCCIINVHNNSFMVGKNCGTIRGRVPVVTLYDD